MHQKLKWLQGKYEVPMLCSGKAEELPNNFNTALHSFRSLRKRLQKDHTAELHQNGYARKLCNKEIERTSLRTWYFPYHPVSNEHKPSKIRIVFDAAAEHDGMSLNKALLTDPDLLKSLTGILVQFRNHKIAIAGDIEAMYHQVRVPKSDAEGLDFTEEFPECDPEVYQMVVHIFGGKDFPCCANYALKKNDNFNCFNSLTIQSVSRV